MARLIDSLVTKDPVGDDLETTLDPKAQQVAYDALEDRNGAVVALDVKTGAVRVLAGTPSFDPNDPGQKARRLNIATQGLFPPGSTMKTVTATAAIDTGSTSPTRRVSGKNGKIISGTPLNNFGGEDFGDITLTEALTHSVNTVWAEVGVKLGARDAGVHGSLRVRDEAADGLPRRPDGAERAATARAGSADELAPVDVGRTAIGQALLLVTPLQMATVAQTIGNGGLRMEPRLVEKVVDPDGRTVEEPLPKQAERVMSRRERGQGGDDDEVGRARGLGHRGRARRASSWPARPARRRSTSTRASTTSGSSASRARSRSP